MIVFGNGAAYGRMTIDVSGASVANPTPVRFAVLQDLGFEESYELKQLHGERQYAIAIGRGKGKLSFKCKLGNYSAAMRGQLLAGRSSTTAINLLQVDDPVAIAASVTTTPPNSGTFVSDLGIINALTGNPFKRVASAPAVGEYTVSGTGTYGFNAADVSAAIPLLRNYEYSIAANASNSRYNFTNDIMGLAPTFSYFGQTLYQGKRLVLSLTSCVGGKISLPQKNDDFSMPDFEFEAQDPGNNVLGYMCITEPS